MFYAPQPPQQGLILAIHTRQCYGDLIRLRCSDFDGEVMRLVQSKTKARVPAPASAALKRMLETMPEHGPFILTRADGRLWRIERNVKELGKSWRRHMQAADVDPKPFEELRKEEKRGFLHVNDLRGTAVTLPNEAGRTVQQVCSITGPILDSATRIRRHYLASTEAIANAAILRCGNAPDTACANHPQTTPQANADTIRKT